MADDILGRFTNYGAAGLTNEVALNDFQKNGFIVPPVPSSDGLGLPSFKVKSNRRARAKRSLIHWFVPEVGIVKMYVNPSSIVYNYKKIIQPERTKGGYNFQYWGEELPTISLNGTTGSSGIEGINVLYEIYRSEQYAFDGIGLTLASEEYAKNQVDTPISSIFGDNVATSIIESSIGFRNAANGLASKNIPTLAQFAFGIEMFYQGWVHRGYFSAMTVTEKEVGLFDYRLEFTSIERRGYRLNNMPWQKSAIDGPSGDAIPYTFK